jgi:hypothetical protein
MVETSVSRRCFAVFQVVRAESDPADLKRRSRLRACIYGKTSTRRMALKAYVPRWQRVEALADIRAEWTSEEC